MKYRIYQEHTPTRRRECWGTVTSEELAQQIRDVLTNPARHQVGVIEQVDERTFAQIHGVAA